jgi:hypothetical protein
VYAGAVSADVTDRYNDLDKNAPTRGVPFFSISSLMFCMSYELRKALREHHFSIRKQTQNIHNFISRLDWFK